MCVKYFLSLPQKNLSSEKTETNYLIFVWWRKYYLELVYNRNQYFGLGPIPRLKPKLADTFGQYCIRYLHHISNGELSYQSFGFSRGYFFHKRAHKTKFLSPFSNIFRLFLKIWVYFQAHKNLHPKEVGNNWK